MHAWWGLNPFIRSLCDRLAQEGFVVVAPDLYHGALATTIEEAEKRSAELDPETVRVELFRALDDLGRLSATKSLGIVGLSLGAYWALWLACARPEHIAAVVAFYGARDEDYGKCRAAFQCHFASDDPYVTSAERREFEDRLRAAERPAEFHDYPGTTHWFFERDRPEAYDDEAASRAWRRTLGFLRDHLTR